MYYNLTNITTNATLLSFTQGVNEHLMGGWLGTLILIAIAFVMFSSFVLASGNFSRSILATSFISFTIALGLAAVGLVPEIAIFITLMATAIGLALIWKS